MSRRLLLSYLALTLVLLAALEIPLGLNTNDRLRSELTANLVRDAYTMAGYAEETVEGNGSIDLDALAATYAARTGGRVVIVDKSGRALADSSPSGLNENFATRPEFIEALAGTVATGTRRSETLDTDLLYVAVPVAAAEGVEGALRITYSTAQIDERRRDYLLTLIGIAVLSMLVASLLGFFLARWVTRPVRRLERTAAGLGAGEMHRRAEEAHGPPEIRELAHTFNAMADRLDELMSSQAAFVADASHQLRTPLAALQLRLENLQAELPQDEDASDPASAASGGARRTSDDVAAALEESDRLARIVGGLLALARADADPSHQSADVVALDEVLDGRVDTWAPIAADHDVRIEWAAGGARARADADKLAQVVDNLLANAIEAAAGGGRVQLATVHVPDTERPIDGSGLVEVHVSDDGPGLTVEQRARAFDRFWRAPRESPSDVVVTPPTLGGTGLGLPIARQLARSMGGDIELRAAPAGGLDAVIVLPRA